MEGTQNFYCWEDGVGNNLIKIQIPKKCLECGIKLNIYNYGQFCDTEGARASYFADNSCVHFATYPLVWKNRILEKLEYGVNCKKCCNFFSYAVKSVGFVCYGCKIGF